MKKAYAVSMAALVVSVLVAYGLVGCEDASDNSLVVTPPSVTIYTTNTASQAQVFVASLANTNSALYFPLVWSVSNTNLGVIAGQEGASAVYTSTNHLGVNIITVRDGGGREGIASVTQE